MRVLDAGLVAVFVLATAIWVGGLVTIAVVAQVAHRTLTPAGSVAFFRRLGRTHGIVGSTALLMALLTRECAAASSSRGRGAHRHCGGRHSPARVPQTEQLSFRKLNAPTVLAVRLLPAPQERASP